MNQLPSVAELGSWIHIYVDGIHMYVNDVLPRAIVNVQPVMQGTSLASLGRCVSDG
jgi:hypothetical protein